MKQSFKLITTLFFVLSFFSISCTKTDESPQETFPATYYVEQIRSRNFIISGHIDMSPEDRFFTYIRLYYSDTGRISLINSQCDSGEVHSDNSFGVGLANLKPDTRYVYLIMIEIRGKKYYSEIAEFTTLKDEIRVVDLGLSVNWTTRNLEAESAEKSGYHYAWGEIEKKEKYSWLSYNLCNGSSNGMTKYCVHTEYGNNGFTDNKTVLEPQDDAVCARIGRRWRIPTEAEWAELMDPKNCKWTWVNDYKSTGISGYEVESKIIVEYPPRAIFLPTTGCRYGSHFSEEKTYGYYWSSSLTSDDSSKAKYLNFTSDHVYLRETPRYYGLSVRPVTKEEY